jgi:hypothetical protein
VVLVIELSLGFGLVLPLDSLLQTPLIILLKGLNLVWKWIARRIDFTARGVRLNFFLTLFMYFPN